MNRVVYILPDGRIESRSEFADGMTLDLIANAMYPESDGKFPGPVMALVGDTPAVRSLGDWDLPLENTEVTFRQIVMGGGGGGGGSNTLQVVMQVAVIALAAVATYFTGGALTPVLGKAAAGIFGGLAGTAVMLLGTMLMGALFQQNMPSAQVPQLDAAQASPTYSINASGNQARLYQPEPEGFGRMKIVPDFVANTWTQYIDNDQIGYFVYGLGRGKYATESLQFGETVFWRDGAMVEGTGYDILDLQFVEPGQAVTIFPDNVETSDEVSGQELFGPNDAQYDGAIGPYITNSAGTETDKLLYDFVFQRGIGTYDDRGNLQYYSVSWDIEYRRIDDFGQPLSDWVMLEHCSFGGATLTPQRLTKTYSVAKGRYETRVRRTSNTPGNGRTMDSLVWVALRAMLPGTYSYPISCVAFSIRATNALTQSASRQFSVIATRKLPLYDRETKTWSAEVPTRSWAAAICHVCKCKWGGQITDANIDLDTLWAIDERLQQKNQFYDSYVDGANLVWNLICEMCQSQCVIPRLIGPILSFVEDGPDRPPSFALTPRNIVRDSFSVTYVTWSDETPDDVNVEYLDAAYGFQQRDVTATLPESESREPANLSILGITDRAHAHRVAVAYAAHNRWQRVIVECQVEALGRIINRGDVCTVAHPRFKNTSSGAVAGWNKDRLEIFLIPDMARKPDFLQDGDADLYLALTRQDGSIWGPCQLESMTDDMAKLAPADYSNLLLQGQDSPFDWLTSGGDRQPTTWTLYISRTYQRLMVVESVTTQDLLHYNLRLSNYDERIYQYSDLPVPPWQGRQQLPSPDLPLDAPTNFRGIITSPTSVTLVWGVVAGAAWYEVETSTDGTNWINMGRANINQLDVITPSGMFYGRVRAASETLQSPWSQVWSADTSIPAPSTPVLALSEPYLAGEASITWSAVTNATHYSVSLSQVENGAAFYAEDVETPGFDITPEIQQGGPYRSLVVSVVAVGERGTSAPALLSLSDPAPPTVTDATIETGTDFAKLTAVSPALPDDGTGYVLIKGDGPNFSASQVTDMRTISSLPYMWVDLSAGTHYFRIAMRDGFFDLTRNPLSLNWSAVLTVNIAGNAE